MGRWIRFAFDSVDRSRALRDNKHLPASPLSSGQPCPSSAAWPMCCPCTSTFPFNSPPRGGPSLAIVPPTLLGNWVQEWAKFVQPDHPSLRMELLVGYGQKVAGATMLDTYPHINRLYISEASEWVESLAASQATHVPMTSRQEADLKAMKTSFGTPRPGQERFVILTTAPSVRQQVLKKLAVTAQVPKPSRGAGSKSRDQFALLYATHWGRAIRDESHEEKNECTTPRVFRALRGRPPCWMLSGTPYETSPDNIAAYVKAIESPQWITNPKYGLSRCTHMNLINMGRRFKSLANNPEAYLEAITTEFAHVLQNLGFMRRTTESRWFGKPIITLPPHHVIDLPCSIHQDVLPTIRKLESEVQRKIDAYEQQHRQAGSSGIRNSQLNIVAGNSIHRLRICNTFPGLLDLANRCGGLDQLPLTGNRLKEEGILSNLDQNIFTENLDLVISKSWKLEKLIKIINEKRTDYLDRPEKLLIMSEFPIVVLIVYLVCTSLAIFIIVIFYPGLSSSTPDPYSNSLLIILDMIGDEKILPSAISCDTSWQEG